MSQSYDVLRQVIASLGALRADEDAVRYLDSRVTMGPFALQASVSSSATSYDLTTASAAAMSPAARYGAGWSSSDPDLALIVLAVRARIAQPIEDYADAAAMGSMGVLWTPSGGASHYLDVPVSSSVAATAAATTETATTVEATTLVRSGWRHLPPARPLVVSLASDALSLEVPAAGDLEHEGALRVWVDVAGLLVRTTATSYPARGPQPGVLPTSMDLAALLRGLAR